MGFARSKPGTRNAITVGSLLTATHRERNTRHEAKRTTDSLMRPTGHKPNKAPKLYPRVSLQLTHSRCEENQNGTHPRTELQRPLRKARDTCDISTEQHES